MRTRLLAAAALCALALGLGWQYNAGSAGYSMGGYAYEYHYSSDAGGYVNEMTYNPTLYYMAGTGPTIYPGAQTDARVILVPAVVLLAWASDVRRRRARTAARAAVGGLVFLVGLAASRGMAAATLVSALAVVLAWPALGLRRPRLPAPEPAPVRGAF